MKPAAVHMEAGPTSSYVSPGLSARDAIRLSDAVYRLPRSPFHAPPGTIILSEALVDAVVLAADDHHVAIELCRVLPTGATLHVNHGVCFAASQLPGSPGFLTATYTDHLFAIQLVDDEGPPRTIAEARLCLICWAPLPPAPSTGRKRQTCSQGCRSALSTIHTRNSP